MVSVCNQNVVKTKVLLKPAARADFDLKTIDLDFFHDKYGPLPQRAIFILKKKKEIDKKGHALDETNNHILHYHAYCQLLDTTDIVP